MKYQKSNQAFTLIEIFVVLIILGVIAALAFPGIFAQIERQRGQEALNSMNLIKSAMESCGVQNSYNFRQCIDSVTPANTWGIIGMDNPSGANFTYTIPESSVTAGGGGAQGSYVIVATRTSSGDTITITRASSGISSCVGTGAFNGFCS